MAALERLAASGGGPEDIRVVAREAAGAARETARAIEALDAELRTLAREADPAERDRLRQRISALGDGGASGAESSRQMRDLLASQLSLMEDLIAHHEALSRRRGRYVELLRTLWLRVAELRAQQAGDALAVIDVTGRVREACRDVERALEAEGDIRAIGPILESPTTPVPR